MSEPRLKDFMISRIKIKKSGNQANHGSDLIN
jgi:hypothetical protein